MSSERSRRRLFFRWTAPKGFAAIVLFILLAVFIEYFLVYVFLSFGLTDNNLLTNTFQIPYPGFSFTVTISPLFHLVPIGVIVVLVSSWTYLTKFVAVVPQMRKAPKKTLIKPKKKRLGWLGLRLKSIRQFSKRIGGKFRGVNRAFKAFYRRISSAALRVRGVSYVLNRLHFARAAIKSAATVLVIFLLAFLALYVLGYPNLIHDAVVGLYERSPFFLGFVLWITNLAHAVGQALSPLGWLASAINKALLAAAPGFRDALQGLGTPIIGEVAKIDLTGKYVLCQNLAAWISAFIALAYGRYASRLYRRRG